MIAALEVLLQPSLRSSVHWSVVRRDFALGTGVGIHVDPAIADGRCLGRQVDYPELVVGADADDAHRRAEFHVHDLVIAASRASTNRPPLVRDPQGSLAAARGGIGRASMSSCGALTLGTPSVLLVCRYRPSTQPSPVAL